MASLTKRLLAVITGRAASKRARAPAPAPPPDPAEAIEAARQRLKRTIEPAEDDRAA